MSRTLTPESNLESLKKEAKAWLKAIRAGDSAAHARLMAALPDVSVEPGLRDIQHALAREFGLLGWAALKDVIDDLALALRSHAELADLLLHSAKPWDSDKPGAARIFSRAFARMPGITRHSLHTAVLCGDLAEVKRHLARDRAAAKQKGGPLDWEPILYLAYGRLPGAEKDAVAIAELLFDHGADPAAKFADDRENPFTLLNGVIGEGEQGRSEHPRAEELATLFIARGTDPFDTQVLYDTSVNGDETRWTDFLWRHCAARGETARWSNVARGIGGRYRRTALDYLLGNAVNSNHLRRAEWLLEHGADANTLQSYSGRPVLVEAQLAGFGEMANLLVRQGATPIELTGAAGFQAAVSRGDFEAGRRFAHADPIALHDPEPLFAAARRNDVAAIDLLLELGMPADLAHPDGKNALHWAAQSGAVDAARRLIAAGVDVDRRGSEYKGTPLGFAFHFDQQAMIDLLAPLTRDVFGLARAQRLERLDELLRADPSLATARNAADEPLLFALPDDEDAAVEAAALMLARGADPNASDKNGLASAESARRRGLDEAADLIEQAALARVRPSP